MERKVKIVIIPEIVNCDIHGSFKYLVSKNCPLCNKPIDYQVKPFLKWLGGKSQIIDDVITLFPKIINNYYEPFLGGGSVLLELLSRVNKGEIVIKGNIYASDINSNLTGLYMNIQLHPKELIKQLKLIIQEFKSCKEGELNKECKTLEEALVSKESYYYWTRTVFNNLSTIEKAQIKGSVMMLFLNKTCFRGMYREGPSGFNVPYGNYKNVNVFDEDNIMNISQLIKSVRFNTLSFTNAIDNITDGDFIYLDPPYVPENKTSFVAYNVDGFDSKKHEQLFNRCKEIGTAGGKFLMSNSDVEVVRKVFEGKEYTMKSISCKRRINSKNPEAKSNELLICN